MFDSEEQTIIPEETAEVVEQPAVETEPTVVTGIVVNCTKLNVREQMNTGSAVLCVLPASSEVKVIADEVPDEWYHVFTASGIEGFCMKQYISINS
jgi:hypothetical protein